MVSLHRTGDNEVPGVCHRTAYILCIFVCFLAISLLPAAAQAHGPKEVVLNYDSGSQTLSVTISHSVSNPQSHYIKEVAITKNGNTLGTYAYKGQPDPSSFTYTYIVEAKKGDTLIVTATCNYIGSKTKELTVGS
ncbi:MAG TPA: hypothetical protein PLA74_08035 [Syntrophales bacterium]|nr:hypothetical protein [Syntrophales bacterium]HPQ43372.1 hypothetical protein [Syntrophales bacterium]